MMAKKKKERKKERKPEQAWWEMEVQPLYLPDWKSALGELGPNPFWPEKAVRRGLRLRMLWTERVPED